MRAKDLLALIPVPSHLVKHVYSRITLTRITTAYFILALLHASIQSGFSLGSHIVNARADVMLAQLISLASVEPNLIPVLTPGDNGEGPTLRLCNGIPMSDDDERCETVFEPQPPPDRSNSEPTQPELDEDNEDSIANEVDLVPITAESEEAVVDIAPVGDAANTIAATPVAVSGGIDIVAITTTSEEEDATAVVEVGNDVEQPALEEEEDNEIDVSIPIPLPTGVLPIGGGSNPVIVVDPVGEVQSPEAQLPDIPLPNLPVPGVPTVQVPEIQLPDVGVDLPDVGVDLPDVGVDLPNVGVDLPDVGAELPDAGVELPDVGIQLPGVGVQLPGVTVPEILPSPQDEPPAAPSPDPVQLPDPVEEVLDPILPDPVQEISQEEANTEVVPTTTVTAETSTNIAAETSIPEEQAQAQEPEIQDSEAENQEVPAATESEEDTPEESIEESAEEQTEGEDETGADEEEDEEEDILNVVGDVIDPILRKRVLLRRTFSAVPVINPTTNLPMGLNITDISNDGSQQVTFIDMRCAKTFTFAYNALHSAQKEDLVLLGYYVYLFGMAVVAIVNESIPHLLAAFLSSILSVAWSAFQLVRTNTFRVNFRTLSAGACGGVDVLPAYWNQRTMIELPSLVLNCVFALILGAFVFKLFGVYNRSTAKLVGGKGAMRHLYKTVMILSIVIQLCSFLLLASVALWVDQLFESKIAATVSSTSMYKGIGVTSMILTLPWFLIGWIAVRKEHKLLMITFLVVNSVFIVSFCLVFASDIYRLLFTQWTFFAAISVSTFALLVISLLFGVLCRLHFGQGLASHLAEQKKLEEDVTPWEFSTNTEKAWEPFDNRGSLAERQSTVGSVQPVAPQPTYPFATQIAQAY